MIAGVGKLITYNSAQMFRISDAVPLKTKYWKVVNPIYAHLWHFLADPAEWCGPEYLDRHKIRRQVSPP